MARFVPGKPKTGGRAKGKLNKATEAVRALVSDNAADIVRLVIEQAKLGDVHAQATFIRMLPKFRFVSAPVDMPLAQSADEAQQQISMLTVMAARGDLDLDALATLTRSLTLAIDTRLEVLEERLGEREREASYGTQE
jgi:hypothetical protein